MSTQGKQAANAAAASNSRQSLRILLQSWWIRGLVVVAVVLGLQIIKSEYGSSLALFSSSSWGVDGAVGGVLNLLTFCEGGCGAMVSKTFKPSFIDTVALFFTLTAILKEAKYIKAENLLRKVVYSAATLLAIAGIAQYFRGDDEGAAAMQNEVNLAHINNAPSAWGRTWERSIPAAGALTIVKPISTRNGAVHWCVTDTGGRALVGTRDASRTVLTIRLHEDEIKKLVDHGDLSAATATLRVHAIKPGTGDGCPLLTLR